MLKEVIVVKRSVVIDGKEYDMIEADKVANAIVFASVLAQVTIIILNWTVWKHSLAVTSFLWGIQLITLILAISMFFVSRHNARIINMIVKRIEEDRERMEAERVEKKKKPRKKAVKDGAK